jgi:phenol 2-monooxygenase
MNVSMQDAFNLGWKLAAVLASRVRQACCILFGGAQAVAKELIDFDREWARILASAPRRGGADAARTQDYFVRHGRYTAGTATHYRPSILTAGCVHQHLAQGPRHRQALPFRAGDPAGGRQAGSSRPRRAGRRTLPHLCILPARRIRGGRLCHSRAVQFLTEARRSPVRRYTPEGADIDAVIDLRAVFQQDHRELAVEAMPSLLLPRKGRYGCSTTKRCSVRTSRAATTFSRCAASIGRRLHGRGAAGPICRERAAARRLYWLASYFDGFMLR